MSRARVPLPSWSALRLAGIIAIVGAGLASTIATSPPCAPTEVNDCGAPSELRITTDTLPRATVGISYFAQLTATGGLGASSVRWTVVGGSLPAGLTIAEVQGSISGVPIAASSSDVIIEAASGGATARRTYRLVVSAAGAP